MSWRGRGRGGYNINRIRQLQERADRKIEEDDLEGALEDLDKADNFRPNDSGTLKVRGNVKRIMGDFEEALEDLDKANELDPNDSFTLSIRGEVKRKLGDIKGALIDLDKADKCDQNAPLTLYYRGQLKKQMGDFEGALIDLNKANQFKSKLSIHSVNPTRKDIENACKEIRILKNSASTSSSTEITSLKQEVTNLRQKLKMEEKRVKELEQTRSCVVCFDNYRNCVLMPCLHLVCCLNCVQLLSNDKKSCPTCRSPISGFLFCKFT